MMKKWILCVFILIAFGICHAVFAETLNVYKANNSYLNYVGRIDFRDPLKPRFWSPGVYVQARFSGTSLRIAINDEELWGKNHNYIDVVIDNLKPIRLKTTGKTNYLQVAQNLSPGIHTVTICKDTETAIGYLEFVSLTCNRLLPWIESTRYKIEFIGNSITCGAASDQSVVPCGKGVWEDQHNAFNSYGARTARLLNAQWQLTAYSGIGLIHSCCDIKFTMPDIWDRLNLLQDSVKWDFKRYMPDVVTLCLGQNDGVQDSVQFCRAYVDFITNVRKQYAKANIVLLSSPMADEKLTGVLKKYIAGVENYMHKQGDNKVSHYFFSRRYHDGCGDHPSIQEHELIANELSGYLRKLKGWH